MPKFSNIAAYKFAPLTELKPLRARLLALCEAGELKGTILLSPEGINLFLAGAPERVQKLLAELRAIPGLAELQPKVSESDHQPFNRMLVRIKKEIIAFGVAGIDPARRPSPKLSARTLKQWLDEGRPVTLLDTRNDYEVKLGTFKNALPVGIDHFREFPAAVGKLPEAMKEQPIVMFCTGGIRCEKASAYLLDLGVRDVFQLDGGILKYLEVIPPDQSLWQGECVVFDERISVDHGVRKGTLTLCPVCGNPVAARTCCLIGADA